MSFRLPSQPAPFEREKFIQIATPLIRNTILNVLGDEVIQTALTAMLAKNISGVDLGPQDDDDDIADLLFGEGEPPAKKRKVAPQKVILAKAPPKPPISSSVARENIMCANTFLAVSMVAAKKKARALVAKMADISLRVMPNTKPTEFFNLLCEMTKYADDDSPLTSRAIMLRKEVTTFIASLVSGYGPVSLCVLEFILFLSHCFPEMSRCCNPFCIYFQDYLRDELERRRVNYLRYVDMSQHFDKPLDGALLLFTSIFLDIRLAVIHLEGIWSPWPADSEPTHHIVYIGDGKFKQTCVGTNIFFSNISLSPINFTSSLK